jgi:hypothetical protein
MTDQCTKQIPGDKYGMIRPCSRQAVQDGLCGQHQPEALAARHAKQLQKDAIKSYTAPWTLLAKAKARIAELEAGEALKNLFALYKGRGERIATLEAALETSIAAKESAEKQASAEHLRIYGEQLAAAKEKFDE